MNYGQKIAELRKNKSLTQAELGAKLNITAQAVSKWENNLSEPDIDSIRKMCEIFEVSVDEFLGLNTNKRDEFNVEASNQPIKAILGYCEKCKKAVCAGEFKNAKVKYNAQSINNKIVKSDDYYTYCNECFAEIQTTAQKEDSFRKEAKHSAKVSDNAKSFWTGLIWGFIVMALVGIGMFTTYAQNPDAGMLTSSIILTLAGLAVTSQFIWGFRSDEGECALINVFLFFCRSFKAPFGLIFELSLDGILWLLTVKLALWIICGLLSIVWFIIGLFVTIFMSIVIFPFSLISNIYSIKNFG